MKNSAQLLEDSLLVIWNDRDPEERLKAMEKIYASDIHFYESNSGTAIIGFDDINNTISNLQSGWGPKVLFELSKPSQTNHNVQLASWILGAPGEKPVASGMDVAIVENEKIKALHLYLD